MRISTSSTMGNSAVAGTEAAICASGCAMRASLRIEADSDAHGNRPQRADDQRGEHATEGRRRAGQDLVIVARV